MSGASAPCSHAVVCVPYSACTTVPPMCFVQVMLVVDNAGQAEASQLQNWQGLQVDGVETDYGDVVLTDVVVSVNLR